MLGSEEHKQIIATKVYATHVILFVVREKKLFCKLLQLCSLKYSQKRPSGHKVLNFLVTNNYCNFTRHK